MRATNIRLGSASIPFRAKFGHAAAIRDRAENVLVQVMDANGLCGIGEGCPRNYVTGEDVTGALAFLEERAEILLAIDSLEALREWVGINSATIDANPSAFCAVELALLDLFARQQGVSIEKLLGIAPAAHPIVVSAVYGLGDQLKFRVQAFLFARNGMIDSKLKLSGNAARDCARARSLARRGRVRLDANNLWPSARAAIGSLLAIAEYAWAIEEPVAARDWEGLRSICRKTGLVAILDESLTTIADLDSVPRDVEIIPNLRVSKLGGLLRSLNMLSRSNGNVIVGAQVGETSILGRAGYAVAQAAGQRLVGFEGAYGPLLLAYDVAKPSLCFGRCGVVKSDLFADNPGFGLVPRPAFEAALLSSSR